MDYPGLSEKEIRVLSRAGMLEFHTLLTRDLTPVPVRAVRISDGLDAQGNLVMRTVPAVSWARAGGLVEDVFDAPLYTRIVEINVWGSSFIEAEGVRQDVLDTLDANKLLSKWPDPPDDAFLYDVATGADRGKLPGVFQILTNVELKLEA